MEAKSVLKKDIIKGLQKLSIGKEDKGIIHSSLSSLGYVKKTEQKRLSKHVRRQLRKNGVTMMPSFNHGRAFGEGKPNYFSPIETSIINGAIIFLEDEKCGADP